MDAMMSFNKPVIKVVNFAFSHKLSVCKCLKKQFSKCAIDKYKRLEEVMFSDNQLFIIIFRVAPIGELRA